MWCACSSSISPCAAATAAFYCLGVCSICIGSGVMSRDSGSRLGWWSVHPIVVRARLISFIRLVHCLILSSHMSRQIEVIKFSTSNTPVYCIFDGNLIKIVYHPYSLVSQPGMLTLPLHICAWKSSCTSKHSYCRFMFFIRTSWRGENWYHVKASSHEIFSLFKSNLLLHGLNNVSIVEQ